MYIVSLKNHEINLNFSCENEITNSILLEACYVDEDCNKTQVCLGGSCQQRLPLIHDVVSVQPG